MNELTVSKLSSLPVLKNKNYNPAIARFNAWTKGRPVTEDTIRDFFSEHAGDFSARTLRLWKAAIKAAVLKAAPVHDIRIRIAMDEVFRQIKTPQPESKLRNSDVFSEKEIRGIIKACTVPAGLFVRALYDTGARISELASVKLMNCSIDAAAVKMRVTGKGGRERFLTLDVELWKRIKKECSGKTFLFEHKQKSYDRKIVWRWIDKAAQRALGRRAHPHQMRHSRITHILNSKIPLSAVSRFAGHARQTTTLNYYAHNEMSDADILKGKL